MVKIFQPTQIMRVEVGIVDPADMESKVALDWFGIDPSEWAVVRKVMKAGTRVLFYVWEAHTSKRERIGSFVYTRKALQEGGMLRLLDADRAVLRQDNAETDSEAIEVIAQWVAALGSKWPHIQVTSGTRSKAEKDLAWDFAALLEYRRAGKIGSPLRTLPVPKEKRKKDQK